MIGWILKDGEKNGHFYDHDRSICGHANLLDPPSTKYNKCMYVHCDTCKGILKSNSGKKYERKSAIFQNSVEALSKKHGIEMEKCVQNYVEWYEHPVPIGDIDEALRSSFGKIDGVLCALYALLNKRIRAAGPGMVEKNVLH